jgi:hypothetical protein
MPREANMDILQDWQRPLTAKLIRMIRRGLHNLVALPTGSGKTYISTAAAQIMKRRPLVICPKSAISSWKNVLNLFQVTPLAIVNWERLKTGKTQWLSKQNVSWLWHLPKDVLVIVDEVHRGCSGINTQIGAALAALKRYPVPVLTMSATVASSPLQMRHTGYLLGLHTWDKNSFFRWCLAHECRFDKMLGHWMSPRGSRLVQVMKSIREKLPDRILYTKIDDIPGFPETLIEAKLFDLDAEETQDINEAWELMSENMKKPGVTELSELMKARHRTEWIKCGLLCDLVTGQLEDGNSVVMFLNFKDTVERVRSLLAAEKVTNVSVLTGDSNDAERAKAMSLFQDNVNHVFLCTPGAGGVAISLHDVKHERPRVAYINPSYSASETKQALGRIQRIGGTKSVQIFPLAAGTIEERVYRTITSKLRSIETLNDGDLH